MLTPVECSLLHWVFTKVADWPARHANDVSRTCTREPAGLCGHVYEYLTISRSWSCLAPDDGRKLVASSVPGANMHTSSLVRATMVLTDWLAHVSGSK